MFESGLPRFLYQEFTILNYLKDMWWSYCTQRSHPNFGTETVLLDLKSIAISVFVVVMLFFPSLLVQIHGTASVLSKRFLAQILGYRMQPAAVLITHTWWAYNITTNKDCNFFLEIAITVNYIIHSHDNELLNYSIAALETFYSCAETISKFLTINLVYCIFCLFHSSNFWSMAFRLERLLKEEILSLSLVTRILMRQMVPRQ